MNAAFTLILACAGIFGFFIILFGFLLLLRYINYRENMKLAEKGLISQSTQKNKPKKGLLISGWIFTIVGFLATIIFWLFGINVTGSAYGRNFPLGLGPWMLLGLLPLFLGLILLLIYVVRSPSHKEDKKDEGVSSVEGFGVVDDNWKPDKPEIGNDHQPEE
jgi:hypothetical protein